MRITDTVELNRFRSNLVLALLLPLGILSRVHSRAENVTRKVEPRDFLILVILVIFVRELRALIPEKSL